MSEAEPTPSNGRFPASTGPTPHPDRTASAPPSPLPAAVLEGVFVHVPVAVVVLEKDGKVAYANPAASRVTGYEGGELVGANFWGLVFPGRLFAQVPKFISAVHGGAILGNDVAMVLRAKDGRERVAAWSVSEANGDMRILFGVDLTDRLNAADVAGGAEGDEGEDVVAVEGEVVTPIAISPPILPGENGGNAAIQQVHDFLVGIEEKTAALEGAFLLGEMGSLAGIAAGLGEGARACGLLGFLGRAEALHAAAVKGAMGEVAGLVGEILLMVRGEGETGNWEVGIGN